MANRPYEQRHPVASIENTDLCLCDNVLSYYIFDNNQIFWTNVAVFGGVCSALTQTEELDFQSGYPAYYRFYGERALFDQAVVLYDAPSLHDVRSAIQVIQDQLLFAGKRALAWNNEV